MNDENNTFQQQGHYPQQGYPQGGWQPQPPPKKKIWFLRHKFLTAILALVLIADADAVVENAGRLVRAATRLGVGVAATEQNPAGLGPTVGAIGTRCEQAIAPTGSGEVAVKITCPERYVSFAVLSATGETVCERVYPLPMVPRPTFDRCGIGG